VGVSTILRISSLLNFAICVAYNCSMRRGEAACAVQCSVWLMDIVGYSGINEFLEQLSARKKFWRHSDVSKFPYSQGRF
jgi:hypothetical protein